MKKFSFKNRKHEFNYRAQMNLVPMELRESAEIQAVIYFIALIECRSPGAMEYILGFVRRSLLPGFFDNLDTEIVAETLARHLWEATYIGFKEDFSYYFFEAFSFGLGEILHCGLLDAYVRLLEQFKDIDG